MSVCCEFSEDIAETCSIAGSKAVNHVCKISSLNMSEFALGLYLLRLMHVMCHLLLQF